MENENKRIIEIPFDPEKEKLIVITKKFLSKAEMEAWLELMNIAWDSKFLVLPSDLVEEIKVIKNIKKE